MKRRATCLMFLLFPLVTAAGTTTWHALGRARVETVASDTFDERAVAPTVRLRASVEHAFDPLPLTALAELEGIAGWDGHYDSGANGESRYPAVTDPTGLEVNQLAATFSPGPWKITAGRQRLLYDNQRFIGNSGWRQNEQTFDAFDANTRTGPIAWRYSYLDRVHRVAGARARVRTQRERDLSAHLLHADVAAGPGTIAAYHYRLEDDTVRTASSRTTGLRWSTSPEMRGFANFEFARQSDHTQSNRAAAHHYHLAEVGYSFDGVKVCAGIERLGGDGGSAFQTPLATLHAFNGWADTFITTPAAGLEDRYMNLSGGAGFRSAAWHVAWHDFRAETSSRNYGSEIDASLGFSLSPEWSALIKLARYSAHDFGTGTTKLWFQIEWAVDSGR